MAWGSPRFKNIAGQRFGRLVALRATGELNPSRAMVWECRCDCGNVCFTTGTRLRGGTKSCGCLQRLIAVGVCRENHFKHGEKTKAGASPEYAAYMRARYRCTQQSYHGFYCYGGRGIKFLFKSFAEFLETVGRRPSARHSLDRINNDGHYEKGNVKWSTRKEQSLNRRKWGTASRLRYARTK
jgi:hypothetical protein